MTTDLHGAPESAAGGDDGLPPDVAPVRPGEELDWPSLERYLRAEIAEVAAFDGPMEVLQFPNGSANLTYFVRFGDRRLVVRRPPFGVIAPGAHDMKREFRALSKLWREFAPAPRAFAFCDDHDVIGSDFLVIDYRPGVVIWGSIPPSMAHHADVGRRAGLAVVDALARLHLVDPAEAGLADLGRPDGFVQRQVSGWTKRWELSALDDSDPLMAVVGQRLADTLPQSTRASILHNDFKIDNCQFDPADPDQVHSIFDWDQATLGDPFVDLGLLLNYWPDPADTPDDHAVVNEGADQIGLPTRAEVVERYSATSGLDVGDVYWYEAFAVWKTAIVLQQLYVRWVRGESTDPRMSTKGEHVPQLARRALRILEQR